MGHRFRVKIWTTSKGINDYQYETFWEGESRIIALLKFWKSTRLQYGHSVLEWRR